MSNNASIICCRQKVTKQKKKSLSKNCVKLVQLKNIISMRLKDHN